MSDAKKLQNEIIEFTRSRDYKLVRELGQGACGRTVLLHDATIDEHFVCKKYLPFDEALRQPLFANFVREIKLLHQLNHRNVVRVFNHYLYPERSAGYILMEHVDGTEIDEHVRKTPESLADLFEQAIQGFSHLEEVGVLHRDIRQANLLVNRAGTLKIIDLGFGKKVATSADFGKSITLNWWCPVPKEFDNQRYDFATEVYFVGQLFQYLISENQIANFKYSGILSEMCAHDSRQRIGSFAAVARKIGTSEFSEIEFGEDALIAYRAFADALFQLVSKIEATSGYEPDTAKIRSKLTEIYTRVMLEEYVPDGSPIIACFLTGTYYYRSNRRMGTSVLSDFTKLLRACNADQVRIIVANINSKLDAVPRYFQTTDEDIPF
ncbi:MAG TPA: protein kinase [Acidobacteriaceae bacterium]